MREKPSTKARKTSYFYMGKLWRVLDRFIGTNLYRGDEDDIDYKGWKDWANKHTPPDKRGGPANPVRRKRNDT